MKRRRNVGWHNPQIFAIPPRELDLLYQAVNSAWIGRKSFSALGISTPIVFSYTTNKAHSRTKPTRVPVQKVVGAECSVPSLGALSRAARYSSIKRLANLLIVSAFKGGGA